MDSTNRNVGRVVNFGLRASKATGVTVTITAALFVIVNGIDLYSSPSMLFLLGALLGIALMILTPILILALLLCKFRSKAGNLGMVAVIMAIGALLILPSVCHQIYFWTHQSTLNEIVQRMQSFGQIRHLTTIYDGRFFINSQEVIVSEELDRTLCKSKSFLNAIESLGFDPAEVESLLVLLDKSGMYVMTRSEGGIVFVQGGFLNKSRGFLYSADSNPPHIGSDLGVNGRVRILLSVGKNWSYIGTT